jgi:hypothetical protein
MEKMTLNEQTRWISGGTAGLTVVIVTQLATRSDLTTVHLAALFCFAISLPFSTIAMIITTAPPPEDQFQRVITTLGAGLMFCTGTAFLFFAFGALLGTTFLIATVVAVGVFISCLR